MEINDGIDVASGAVGSGLVQDFEVEPHAAGQARGAVLFTRVDLDKAE